MASISVAETPAGEMREALLRFARGALDDAREDWVFEGLAGHTAEEAAASDAFDTVIDLRSPMGETLGGTMTGAKVPIRGARRLCR